jgi:very-short-patch-repair endonuclease
MDSTHKFANFVEQFKYQPNRQFVPILPKQELTHHKHYRASSKGERYVLDFIHKQGFQFDREKEYPLLKDDKPLRYDFYLPELKLLIEVDGTQHYQGSVFHRTREEWMKQIRHDEMKNQYCKENHINLVRIPCTCSKNEVFSILDSVVADIRWGKEVFEVDIYFKKKAGVACKRTASAGVVCRLY